MTDSVQNTPKQILCEGGPLNGVLLDAVASFGPYIPSTEFATEIATSESGAPRQALYTRVEDGVVRDTPVFKFRGVLVKEDPFSDVPLNGN